MARQRSIRLQYENGKHEKFITIEMTIDELKRIVKCMEFTDTEYDFPIETTNLMTDLKDILEKNK